jgi:hypothetical protein
MWYCSSVIIICPFFVNKKYLGYHLWGVRCVDFQGRVSRAGIFGDPCGNLATGEFDSHDLSRRTAVELRLKERATGNGNTLP